MFSSFPSSLMEKPLFYQNCQYDIIRIIGICFNISFWKTSVSICSSMETVLLKQLQIANQISCMTKIFTGLQETIWKNLKIYMQIQYATNVFRISSSPILQRNKLTLSWKHLCCCHVSWNINRIFKHIHRKMRSRNCEWWVYNWRKLNLTILRCITLWEISLEGVSHQVGMQLMCFVWAFSKMYLFSRVVCWLLLCVLRKIAFVPSLIMSSSS